MIGSIFRWHFGKINRPRTSFLFLLTIRIHKIWIWNFSSVLFAKARCGTLLGTFWTRLKRSFHLHLYIVLDYKYPRLSKAALPPKILDQLRPLPAIALKLTLFSSLNYFSSLHFTLNVQ